MDSFDYFDDAVLETDLRNRKPLRFGDVFLGLDGQLGLLGDARFFAQVDFAFQDLEHLEHYGRRQRTFAAAAGAGTATGRIDQVLGPTVHRVGPEFALGDRHSLLA